MTDIDPAALLAEANRVAQRRFHAMLEAKAYSDPNDPLTVRYIEAERVVDDILGEVQWEASKAGMDALQSADAAPYAPTVDQLHVQLAYAISEGKWGEAESLWSELQAANAR